MRFSPFFSSLPALFVRDAERFSALGREVEKSPMFVHLSPLPLQAYALGNLWVSSCVESPRWLHLGCTHD